jgi:AcrR family transcriptional regulator
VATRHRLLDAGVALMASVQVSDLMPGVRAVCREAGLPTGSFYHCFGDTTAFHVALAERMIDQPPSTDRVERYTARAERIVATGESGAEVVARVASNGGAGLDYTLAELRDATRAQQLLASVADRDDAVAAATRQAYGERIGRTSARQREAMETFLGTLGCSIRPPFTVESVVDLLAAVADGLVMRAQLDPGFDAATLLEDTVRVVFVALLQGDHDELDLDDLLAVVADAAGIASSPASPPRPA